MKYLRRKTRSFICLLHPVETQTLNHVAQSCSRLSVIAPLPFYLKELERQPRTAVRHGKKGGAATLCHANTLCSLLSPVPGCVATGCNQSLQKTVQHDWLALLLAGWPPPDPGFVSPVSGAAGLCTVCMLLQTTTGPYRLSDLPDPKDLSGDQQRRLRHPHKGPQGLMVTSVQLG